MFFDCIDETCSFGNGNGYTKAYALKAWVRDEMHEYYSSTAPIPLLKYLDKGDLFIPLFEIPTSAIEELDKLGKPRVTNFIIPAMVELNYDALSQAINNFEKSPLFDETRRDDYRNYNDMIDLRFSLNNTLVSNFIPQNYREGTSGRLCPHNASTYPSIIPMSKEVKALIFSGKELYDYDVSNCHFAIFIGLCKRYGIECPCINDYMKYKKEYRQMWCEEFQVGGKILKANILSWLYGAKNNPIVITDLQAELGYEALEAIQNDRILSRIYDEIQFGRKVIVEHHRNSNGLITNILGKEQPRKDVDKKNKLGSELSHIQFGIESKIMEIVNHFVPNEMILLIYDGWISNKVDISAIEQEVKNQLGFDIKFEEELIQPPILDDLMRFKNSKKNRETNKEIELDFEYD